MCWVSRGNLTACLLATSFLFAPSHVHACSAKSIFVKGRVEDPPPGAAVSVELVYERGLVGESDHLMLDGPAFRTRITFSTQSRSVDLMGHAIGKCARKPTRVIVTLLDDDKEVDRVTLRVPEDLTQSDSTELSTKSDVVLHGPR
jgi:hypothetical protein